MIATMLDDIVMRARAGQRERSQLSRTDKVRCLQRLLDSVERHTEQLASAIIDDIGKPIDAVHGEISFFVRQVAWYVTHSQIASQDEVIVDDVGGTRAVMRYLPYGVVGVILPRNSPFGLWIRKVSSALCAGNSVIVSHAPQASRTAAIIEQIVETVGLPDGVYQSIGSSDEESAALVSAGIDCLSFTGSSAVGMQVYESCVRHDVHPIIEGGGSNPCIVHADADLAAAATRIVAGRCSSNGQNCDAIKRVIVHRYCYDALVQKITTGCDRLIWGDPREHGVMMTHLCDQHGYDCLDDCVSRSCAMGARVVYERCYDHPLAYPLTIVTDVSPAMPVRCEETFGPVLPIMTYETIDEAVQRANASPFGLGASVYTADMDVFDSIASQLVVGTLEHNAASQRGDPAIPYGGTKCSGRGWANGIYGLREMMRGVVVCGG